ncbi:MAG: FtsQ-type POTRA domain-containing protein [Eubacteriales bacterium]|nr:FtsQ-type POTRA domain-containing protein [Eubacteriales bacterium]
MKGRRKKLIISLIVILVCCAAAVAAGSFVFRISEVRFIGNGNVPSEELLHRSGIRLGETNVFMLDKQAVTLLIESGGDVTVRSIERRFPSTVVIVVTERVECAQIQMAPGQFLSIDSEGRMMKVYAQDPGLLRVMGVGELTVYVDGTIESADARKYEDMRAVLSALEQAELLKHVTAVDVSDSYGVKLETDWTYQVNLGMAEKLASKLTDLSGIAEILASEGKNGGTINMSVGGKYTYDPAG